MQLEIESRRRKSFLCLQTIVWSQTISRGVHMKKVVRLIVLGWSLDGKKLLKQFIRQVCGNTMPDLPNLVHVRNFNLLVLGQGLHRSS